jgi:pimeloyl-ACP methyl ester carboxylesterase
MAHGFSLTRHDGLPAYAERLAAAGADVLLFDYRHRPVMKAPKVRCPLWVGLGDHDISVSGKAVARLAARAPRAELHRYPYSHFEPFMEQAPDKVAADQVDFLRRMGVL